MILVKFCFFAGLLSAFANGSGATIEIITLDNMISQEISINGTVTDCDGMPIPGVNILEKGTTNGANTDFDGNYSITVKDSRSILQFSYVGYKMQELSVGDKTTINIRLVTDEAQLDEVVVIGYGTQNQRKVSGAVGKVDPAEIEDYPVSNFDQALTGKLVGVQVLQSTGHQVRN